MDSFKTLQDSISSALIATTRAATRVHAADIAFQRSFDPALGAALDTQNERLLQLTQRLLANAAASSDAVGPKLPDVDAIDSNWRGIVDVVDSLLERADTSLDEFTGVVKRLGPGGDQATAVAKRHHSTLPKSFPKPQLSFEHVPRNNETDGFRPLLTSKPHAQVPLAACLETLKDSHGREQYPHPYQTEIESYEYPPRVYQKSDPQPYAPFKSTTATFVDTPEALALMLAELKTAKEIAVDLEHHDNRSYNGIVSLMQISTRNSDWIVDTLVPWRRRLECLNEVFADPRIVKVLHGAYMDIVWLQRDLGLYVVGLFDTFHAARALGYVGASLAFLLDKFVNFKAQKQYQMADWRMRPLSDELFEYARADTHFLLYIFDNMRNELVGRSDYSDPENNKISDVLINSRQTALQRYEHPIYDTELGLGSGGWYRLLTRTLVRYTPQQFAVFKAVHKWRDDVARTEDESVVFVTPNHAVFSVAREMPEDKVALFKMLQHISPILRARADELVAVIAEAKAVDDDAPDMNVTLTKIGDMLHQKYLKTEEAKSTTSAVDVIHQSKPLEQVRPIPTLDTPPLRAPASSFWGSLCSGGEERQQRPFSTTTNVSLALPLPSLTAEIFTERTVLDSAEETPTADRREHAFISKEERPAEDQRTDIFIVKQLGGKRKRAQAESEEQPESLTAPPERAHMAEPADEAMLDESAEARKRRLKKEAKLRKKERKQQEALQEASAPSEGLNYDGVEPALDYASAPSVLRGQEKDRTGSAKNKKKDKRKSNQGFNPYAKMSDAPKGLPRTQKESAGRSKTFKS